MLTAAWDKVSPITVQNCFKRAGVSKESQECSISDTDDPFKKLDEQLDNLKKGNKITNHQNLMLKPAVIECDELLTADTELPSDADIIAAFQPNSNQDQEEEEEDEDEVVTEEPPPRQPSRQELSHAVDVLQTLFVGLDVNSFTSKKNYFKNNR